MSGMLESLTNPANKSQLEERMARVKEDPSLKPILDEIENGGPAAMMRSYIFTSFVVDLLVDFVTSFMRQSCICMCDGIFVFILHCTCVWMSMCCVFSCGF